MSGSDRTKRLFEDFLAGVQDAQGPRLVIVTGERGAGKTIWCTEVARHASASGITVGGLLSPAVFVGDQKIGIDLLDIATQDRRRLANRRPKLPENPGGMIWQFDQQTLQWGNEALLKISNCRLLILDELGPLELLEGQGFTRGLEILDRNTLNATACAVIRPSLVSNARARWPWATCLSLDGSPI
jgi:nucleoside-triphosphatase THEP1